MKLPDTAHTALTYCLNVHPGESWEQNLEAIQTHTRAIRDRVAPGTPFGLGLRLSARAVEELARPNVLASFRSLLDDENFYVFTINGFPYGRFHGGRVKERVYQPDWTDTARVTYTCRLADVLAQLLPEGEAGSISTVPGAYRVLVRDARDRHCMAGHLASVVHHFAQLEEQTGREIHLGLEPEPDCFMETTDDVLSFFENDMLTHGRACLMDRAGCSADQAERWIRRHLGVCVDTCHVAMVFEDPAAVLDRYQAAGVRLSKIQLSAALETPNHESGRNALRPFDENVYLHQVKGQTLDGRMVAWRDLPDALAALPRQAAVDTLRVHFHVPLFWQGADPLRSTAHTLRPDFWARLRKEACPHLEIETYTFDVLPEGMRSGGIEHSVAAEYAWVMQQWNGATQ